MKNNIIKQFCLGVVSVSCLLSSCSNDEINSKELKVYVNTSNTGVANNSVIKLLHTPLLSMGDSTISFPVKSVREMLADTEVYFEVDNSLIEDYNSKNELNLQPVDQDAYTLKSSVVISAGTIESKDSIHIEIDKSKLKSKNGYLIPLTIREIRSKDKGLEISSNLNTVYLVINNSFEYIYLSDEDPKHNSLDNSDWKLSVNTSYNSMTNESKLIDNSFATSWFAILSRNPELTIDLNKNSSVKSVAIYNNYYMSRNYAPKHVELFALIDNEWESQGVMELKPTLQGSSTTNPGVQYLVFYNAITTSALKLKVHTSYGYYMGISEIKVLN